MACNMFLTLTNGAKLPVLGYGTLKVKDDILEKSLDEALKVGYRYIDTAQAYQNEEVIGRVLKRWFDSGKLKREDIFITTKLSPYTMTPDNVEESIIESLKKLQLDYVDLYLLHFPIGIASDENGPYGRTDFHYLDIWKEIEEQYDAGRAKTIGISNFNAQQIDNLLQNCRIKPVNNQIEMHVFIQHKDIVSFCHQNGITVTAYSSLGSRGSAADPSLKEEPLTDKTVLELAKKYSKSPAQILLRFMLQLGVSTIPKSVTPARIKENISIFDFKLVNEDIQRLKSLDKGIAGTIVNPALVGRLSEHPDYPYI